MSCSTNSCCGITCCDLPNPSDLSELRKGLNIIFTKCDDQSKAVGLVTEYMRRYKSNEKDWEKYVHFDDQKYTRNLVEDGNGKYNLIVLCWNYGQGSTIHGHADSSCYMKILSGEATEEHFNIPDGSTEGAMVPVKKQVHKRDDVCYIADKLGILHRVSNASQTEQLVTLHLYVPAFSECAVFEEGTGHKTTGKMTYWSIDGKKVPQ